MGKDFLLKKINDAKEGLPETLLSYIDRQINNVNVKSPEGYIGKKLSELIKEDITYISSLRKSRIRAIVGKVGSGKTTLSNKYKDHFLELLQKKGVVFSLKLSDISVINNQDFARDVSKTIYNQIKKYYDFLKLNEYTEETLSNYFSDFEVIDAIKNIRSNEINAKKFFFTKITEGGLIELLEGYLKIAFSKNYPVIFIIDELNYLIKNDPDERKIWTNIIVQRLMRGWWQKFSDQPLLLICNCLTDEFNILSQLNPSFYSIINKNTIELDIFSKKEKRELIELIYYEYEEYLGKNLTLDTFIDKIEKTFEEVNDKEKLDYYLKDYARGFVQIIATIMSQSIDIDYLQNAYSIYEDDAKKFIKPILKERNFNIENISDQQYLYDGFGIDIYAENKSGRSGIIRALGECKSRKFTSKYMEEWEYKLIKLGEKGSYKKDFDYIFTIAPDYTPDAEKRLRLLGCDIYRYISERADNLTKLSIKSKIKPKRKINPLIEPKNVFIHEEEKGKESVLDNLTRIQGKVLNFIENRGGKVGIRTLKTEFGDEPAIRLIKDLEKLGKIEKEKQSYKLRR